MATNKNSSTVDKLIETLRGGEDGFKTAAEKIEDTSIKSRFIEFSSQRHIMAGELLKYSDNGEADSAGAIFVKAAGVAHRGWIDLKSALGGGDKSILNEAERGEDYAVSVYKDALKEPLSPDLTKLLQQQFTTVKATHDKVRSLRDSL